MFAVHYIKKTVYHFMNTVDYFRWLTCMLLVINVQASCY